MLTSQSNHQRVVELNPSDTSGRQDISKKLKGHSKKLARGVMGHLYFNYGLNDFIKQMKQNITKLVWWRWYLDANCKGKGSFNRFGRYLLISFEKSCPKEEKYLVLNFLFDLIHNILCLYLDSKIDTNFSWNFDVNMEAESTETAWVEELIYAVPILALVHRFTWLNI